MTSNLIYHGTKTNASDVATFLEHMIHVNLQAEADGQKQIPLCIWGKHGIGKTELVEHFARENKMGWAYIAPAQFEEMGDLVGMPRIENGVTAFAAPEWVPTEEGPGILLIDDVNRADDRILRGIMQLLQNYELVSWKLPPKWHIVMTANPDGGDYAVTPMDDAMLTRMMHVTMEFDVKEWARWAEANDVDQRGINFILTYPEIVTGNRTTPRTLVQFFESITRIPDLEAQSGLVQILGDSCLDPETVSAFMAFVANKLTKLATPEEIVNAKDFPNQVDLPLQEIVLQRTVRVDILSTLATRLVNYLTFSGIAPDKIQLENIKSFIKLEYLPNDIRMVLAKDLVASSNT
ncbi:MAG: AAA family ATPase, partial [Bacteroidota bacterium]